MASTTSSSVHEEIDYPTGDGQPMAETPTHRRNMTDLIEVLERRYADDPGVYVSGNMFVYYVEGNRNRHLAPDVFVVFGVPRKNRDCYKTWEEPKRSLDLVVEFTSRSTREEDLEDKFRIYRDELGVREYLLFDPYAEYLEPPEQLYRLAEGEYQPVEPVGGRLPSEVLGLHFEREGRFLRLYDPATDQHLLTAREENERLRRERDRTTAELRQAEAEIEQLRRELERLKQGPAPPE